MARAKVAGKTIFVWPDILFEILFLEREKDISIGKLKFNEFYEYFCQFWNSPVSAKTIVKFAFLDKCMVTKLNMRFGS